MKKSLLLASVALLAVACQPAADKASADKTGPVAATNYAKDILPDDAVPVSYRLIIGPNIETKSFEGVAYLTFDVKNPTDKIVVNGINLEIDEAKLDKFIPAQVAVDAEAERITFSFDEKLPVGEHELYVRYYGKLYDNAAGIFISTYPTPDGQKSLIASQFEPGDARKVAPMWDEPAHKAVFNISMILPEGMMAVSNMPVAQQTQVDDGLVRTDFMPTPKMSSYLLYFGAGDLERITKDHNGVELGIVARTGEARKGQYALDATGEILDYYNDYFGTPYPLPKLDQVAAPGAGGFAAMENWGAILYFEPILLVDPQFTTASEKQFIFTAVAHEIAHQWFGDLVTMEWWDDLWLNESFASWMEAKMSDRLNPGWKIWLQSLSAREYAYSLDRVASTHPVSQPVHNLEEATTSFDAITYQKGQMVIRMIEDYVGEDAFREGVRAYMKKHAYSNTVMDDLWGAIDKASPAPVLDIAHDFTLQPGVPMIAVDSAICNDAGDATTVTLRQLRFGADENSKNTPLTWRTPVKAQVVGGEVARATISGPTPQTMSLPGCGAVKVNAGESGYYRTLYADGAFSALSQEYGDLADIDRLGLLQDAFGLGNTGYAPLSRFLGLVDQTPTDGDAIITLNVVSDLVTIDDLFKGQSGADAFKAYALTWLQPVFAMTGWDAPEGESENEAILRTSMIRAMALVEDPDVVAESQRRFAAYLKDPASVDPDLVRTLIDIVAANADDATFDQLLAKARSADNPREARVFYGALDGIKDEAVARRALEVLLSDEISAQYRPRYFLSMADDHPRMIWDYYREHFEEIEADLDPLERIDYAAELVAATDDPEIAAEFEVFAKENLPDSAQKSVQRALQTIRLHDQIKKERLPEIVAWLEARN